MKLQLFQFLLEAIDHPILPKQERMQRSLRDGLLLFCMSVDNLSEALKVAPIFYAPRHILRDEHILSFKNTQDVMD